MRTTLILCVLFVAAFTAQIERVCNPPQWEAKIFAKIASIADDKPMVMGMLSNVSWDFTNKREAIHEVIDSNGQKMRYNVIIDYVKVQPQWI